MNHTDILDLKAFVPAKDFESDTPGEAGGLMSGVASKAITQVI
jgi:hypothetical protein